MTKQELLDEIHRQKLTISIFEVSIGCHEQLEKAEARLKALQKEYEDRYG